MSLVLSPRPTSASLRGDKKFHLVVIMPDSFHLFHGTLGVWWKSGGFGATRT